MSNFEILAIHKITKIHFQRSKSIRNFRSK